jgi:ribosomal protein S18 acetylase RimI-like enzyme
MNWHETIQIQELYKEEAMPYELLLLADPSKNMIDGYIHSSFVYIAKSDEQLVAVYALQEIDQNSAEIKNLAVAEALQGKGLGTYLLHHCISIARKKGYTHIIIGTGDTSSGQLHLYQKLGFEIFAIKENFFTNHYPEPIYENGIQCKHMILLQKKLR